MMPRTTSSTPVRDTERIISVQDAISSTEGGNPVPSGRDEELLIDERAEQLS